MIKRNTYIRSKKEAYHGFLLEKEKSNIEIKKCHFEIEKIKDNLTLYHQEETQLEIEKNNCLNKSFLIKVFYKKRINQIIERQTRLKELINKANNDLKNHLKKIDKNNESLNECEKRFMKILIPFKMDLITFEKEIKEDYLIENIEDVEEQRNLVIKKISDLKKEINHYYQELYDKALNLVTKEFENTQDRGGKPYLNHLKFVSDQQDQPYGKIIGLLHDVLEDTLVTENELRKLFPEIVVDSVKILTKRKNANYDKYIDSIIDSKNMFVYKVKLADLRHNSDLTRLVNPGPNDYEHLEKYQRSYIKLKEALAKLEG